MPEHNVVVGWGIFGKNGELGYDYERRPLMVGGMPFKKALSMHPPSNGASKVTYRVPEQCTHFEGVAAMNDSAGGQRTPVGFKVFGDNRLLWSSRPLRGAGRSEDCKVEFKKGTKENTLVVECPGEFYLAYAAWCDPHLTKE